MKKLRYDGTRQTDEFSHMYVDQNGCTYFVRPMIDHQGRNFQQLTIIKNRNNKIIWQKRRSVK